MEINKNDILHIAELCSLNINEDEVNDYVKDLGDIISFVNKIDELDTSNLEETSFALDGVNVFRKDEVKPSFDRELLMKNAPSSNGVAIQLPPILE